MDYFRQAPGRVKQALVNDVTLRRTARYGKKAARAGLELIPSKK